MTGIPKRQLDLDQMMEDQEGDIISLADSAIADGVEDEKCVVGQYRTNKQQKQAFAALLETCDRDSIPIEWVIDIADESNGWFYGTAYHFDDTQQLLHVMVPDKVNPTFDGQVQLDYRTVHLIECVDRSSQALFNKIVRDSVVKVKWDVEWFEEYEDENNPSSFSENGNNGQWIYSVARYYIRIANQLLVEDREYEEENADNHNSKGFVIITADVNVRLLHCHRNKGIEDFYRLIHEGVVSFTEEAEEEATVAMQNLSIEEAMNRDETQTSEKKNSPEKLQHSMSNSRSNQENHDPQQQPSRTDASVLSNSSAATSPAPLSLKKLTDVVRHLKDSLQVINDDFEKKKKEEVELSDLFQHFVLSGDLTEGLQLMEYFQKIQSRHESRNSPNKALFSGKKSKTNLLDDANNDVLFSPGMTSLNETKDDWEETVDDPEEKQFRKVMKLLDHAMHNSTKLEKQCVKLLKHGYDILNTGTPAGGVINATTGKVEEYELLKKDYKRLKKELDQKEQELKSLKNTNNGVNSRR